MSQGVCLSVYVLVLYTQIGKYIHFFSLFHPHNNLKFLTGVVVNASTSLQFNVWLRNIKSSLPSNVSSKYASLLRRLYGDFDDDDEIPVPGMRFRRIQLLLTPPIRSAEDDGDDDDADDAGIDDDAGLTMLFNVIVKAIHLKLSYAVFLGLFGLSLVLWGVIELTAAFSLGERLEKKLNAWWWRWRRRRRRREMGMEEDDEEQEGQWNPSRRRRSSVRTPLLGSFREGII